MKVRYIKKSGNGIDHNIISIYTHVLKYGYSIKNGWKDKTGVVGLMVYGNDDKIRRIYILYPKERIVTSNEQ